MGRKKQHEKAEAMYQLYQQGMSCEEVGKVFGFTRQSVAALFRRHRLERRKKEAPKVMYNGSVYALNGLGYYKKTARPRTQLHRDIWEDVNGPIPDGLLVHHKDGNKANNSLNNLELVRSEDHGRRHVPLHAIEKKGCLFCGKNLVRKLQRNGRYETPAQLKKRAYCDSNCQAKHKTGKPKNWGPNVG